MFLKKTLVIPKYYSFVQQINHLMINNNRKGEAKFSKCLKRKRKKMKIAN